MGEYKTPGVYIKEKNAFGNSVVEAETAIPAFIGYTEIAQNGNDDLMNKPLKISSMAEFMKYFGGAPMLDMEIDIRTYHDGFTKEDLGKLTDDDLKKVIAKPSDILYEKIAKEEKEVFRFKGGNTSVKKEFAKRTSLFVTGKRIYTLYYNMSMFFANGGSACYVVSVGKYSKEAPLEIKANELMQA